MTAEDNPQNLEEIIVNPQESETAEQAQPEVIPAQPELTPEQVEHQRRVREHEERVREGKEFFENNYKMFHKHYKGDTSKLQLLFDTFVNFPETMNQCRANADSFLYSLPKYDLMPNQDRKLTVYCFGHHESDQFKAIKKILEDNKLNVKTYYPELWGTGNIEEKVSNVYSAHMCGSKNQNFIAMGTYKFTLSDLKNPSIINYIKENGHNVVKSE